MFSMLPRLAGAFCCLAVLAAGFCQAYAQPARLKFVGIADTDAVGVGEHVQAALSKVSTAILQRLPSDRKYNELALIGADCEIDKIMQSINGLSISAGDTVVVYYAGHGAFDPNRGTLFLPHRNSGNGLPLRRIVEAIEQKQPRLIVMLVDCCQTPLSGNQVSRMTLANVIALEVPPLHKSLYFDAAPGTVIVFATERNEAVPCGIPVGDGTIRPGTLFSQAFAESSAESDKPLGWKGFGTAVKSRVNQLFQQHQRDSEGRLILANDQHVAIAHQRVWAQTVSPAGQVNTIIAPR